MVTEPQWRARRGQLPSSSPASVSSPKRSAAPSPLAKIRLAADTVATGPIGVIDIGSNSIRLVVFEGLAREPAPIFNEKVFAALGKTVGETGRLNPEGLSQAFSTLTRFSRLLKAMKVTDCHVVATAAVRDAADGAAFLEEVKRRAELNITIISGEEEGRLSAEGVLSGIPDADGAMGDMGGGSVELVRLARGVVGERTTMPFGPFRLMALGGSHQSQVAAVDTRLAALPWLPSVAGAALYAVGGIWRAFAKVHMEQVGHPLHVIHHYAGVRPASVAPEPRVARRLGHLAKADRGAALCRHVYGAAAETDAAANPRVLRLRPARGHPA
jgi:exopolyphosphatase/guanosine-5'-triphosphate,3'-diphosphate pyrophosphatase